MIALRGGVACSTVLCVSLACSEGQYNPALPTAGSGGMTANAGAGGGSAGSGTGGSGGGAAGMAGSGAGGAPAGVTEVYDFEDDLEGFRINYYCDGNPPVCVPVMDAPAPPAGAGAADGGAGDAGNPVVQNDFYTTEHDATVGDPDPGSAKITFQFSLNTAAGNDQRADFARNFGSNTEAGLNLTGKTITLRARVEAGGPPTVAGKMYVKTGETYSYADSGEVTLVPGVWTTLSYAMPTYILNAALYDVSDVREIGVEFIGRGATAVTPTVVHVDTISY